MTLLDRLRHHAKSRPEKIFAQHFVYERSMATAAVSSLTYAELFSESMTWAKRLPATEIGRAVIPIFLPQGLLAYTAFLGVMMAGGIPTFMPLPSSKQDVATYWSLHIKLFDRIQPKLIIAADEVHDSLARAFPALTLISDRDTVAETVRDNRDTIPAAQPGDVAFLQHSSGTTGLKKGVMLTHEVIAAQMKAYAEAVDFEQNSVIASWLPLYHDMGLIACFMLPLYYGATVVTLDPFSWSASPSSLLEVIEQKKATHCWMPNFAFEHIARRAGKDATYDLSSIRAFVNCSEPCRAETFEHFAARFANRGFGLAQMKCTYAMAETVFAVSHTQAGRPSKVQNFDSVELNAGKAVRSDEATAIALVSSGKPLEGVNVTIHDEGGEALPEGIIGEIAIQCPFLAAGYYRNDKDTQVRFRDGKYFTRDRGFLLNSEVYVLGRLDDMIIVNGRNFHANHIEAVVANMDGLLPGRCVALPLYNPNLGTNDVVLVAETAVAQELQPRVMRAIREGVFEAMGLMLSKVMLVDANWIMKTTSGKVSREANLEKFKKVQSL